MKIAMPEAALLLAPLIFAAHIAEEAPGYVRWFNSIVSPGLPEGGFIAANVTPLVITAVLAAFAAFTKWRAAILLLLFWAAYFFFANGLFHIVATIAMRRYSPGVITAVCLYAPFCAWFYGYLRRLRVGPDIVALVTLLAGLPLYLQTFMVVFEGKRFF